jgi:hypothetical protein
MESGMERRARKVKIASRKWTLRGLFPADFLALRLWPFAHYRLIEDMKKDDGHFLDRDWKLKPKNKLDEEVALEEGIKRALVVGASLKHGQYAEIKADEQLHSILLAEIYAMTYGLSPADKVFNPFKLIDRHFAETIFAKSKALCLEPYAFMADVAHEAPELYNPRRWDFNLFILGVGWDQERRAMEKAQAEMRSKMPRPLLRRR